MKVEVEHLLSPRLPDVKDELVPCDLFFFRKLLRFEDKKPWKMGGFRCDIGEGCYKALWNEEEMCPSFGPSITECKHFGILKNNVRWDLSVTNSMEYRLLLHEKYHSRTGSPEKRYCDNG